MLVKVLFFASARDATGKKKIEVELSPDSTGEQSSASEIEMSVKHLIAQLEAIFPNLNVERDQISLAINQVYCSDEALLKDGDEVAFLPPISGG
jgi:molybdopterin synthase sulfur carrier subunit